YQPWFASCVATLIRIDAHAILLAPVRSRSAREASAGDSTGPALHQAADVSSCKQTARAGRARSTRRPTKQDRRRISAPLAGDLHEKKHISRCTRGFAG